MRLDETTRSASREPPTLARRFPVVPGARLYPLVPPLPVLSSLKPDHLLSAVMPAYALRADGGRVEIRSTIRAASSSRSNSLEVSQPVEELNQLGDTSLAPSSKTARAPVWSRATCTA